MTTLAADTTSWTLDDPVTVIAYGLIGLVAWILTARLRRSLADPARPQRAADLGSHPYHVAYLAGGRDRAVLAALIAMRMRGLLATTNGRIRAAGRVEHGAAELERAIHGATATPLTRLRLTRRRPVSTALTGIRKDLHHERLLLTGQQRAGMRAVGLLMLAVAVGSGYAMAITRTDSSVLMLLGAVFLVVGVLQVLKAPRMSRTAVRELAALRDRHDGLRPALRPDWGLYGSVGAAMGVGLFGLAAISASDPAFFSDMGLQRVRSSGDGGSGGGCGGDSGSSCGGGCGGGGGD